MKDRIRVRLRGFDVRLIDDSARGIVQTVQKAGAKVAGPIPLPTRINKFTVLRSPHVHKKSREQFEMRTHKRLIDIIDPTPDVMDALYKLAPGMEVDPSSYYFRCAPTFETPPGPHDWLTRHVFVGVGARLETGNVIRYYAMV